MPESENIQHVDFVLFQTDVRRATYDRAVAKNVRHTFPSKIKMAEEDILNE